MKSRNQLIKTAIADASEGRAFSNIYPNSSGQFGSTLSYGDKRVQYKVDAFLISREQLILAADTIAQDPRVEKAYITQSGFIRVNFHQSFAAEQASQ